MNTMDIKSHYQQHGFSLVELLVGMAMGLFVMLIIGQTFSVAEGYKRTTTSGSDAQINGLMAMRTLESEIRVAGYGTMNTKNLCPSINKIYEGVTSLNTTLIPVRIVDGGTGSDSIEVVYSGSSSGAAPTRITTAMPTPSNVTRVSNLSGINTCDFVLYAAKDGSKSCTMAQVTDTQGNGNVIQFLTGSGQSHYNPPGGFNQALFPPGGYGTSDIIINMGSFVNKRFSVYKTPSTDEYFLRQTNVNAADDNCPASPTLVPDLDLISNIVNIQAEYGVANSGSQQVNCWTSAAATDTRCTISTGNWSSPVPLDINRIKAVRVALVARSALSEKPSAAGGSCDTTTTAPASWDGGPTIDLSSNPDWQCYRYKVYQTVIPVINVIWANI
jgi:type IV pilus assembly protein PilW